MEQKSDLKEMEEIELSQTSISDLTSGIDSLQISKETKVDGTVNGNHIHENQVSVKKDEEPKETNLDVRAGIPIKNDVAHVATSLNDVVDVATKLNNGVDVATELNKPEMDLMQMLMDAAADKDFSDEKMEIIWQQIEADSLQINMQKITKEINEIKLKPIVASASAVGHLEFVKFLLDKGFNIDSCDEDRMTGVMNATLNDHTQVAIHLIEKGAMLNTLNLKGETVVHIATRRQNAQLLEKLIMTGANPNYQNIKGDTALHIACQLNNSALGTILLYLGANMDYTNQMGESALHEACRNEMHQVIQVMCLQGCNVEFENKTGQTALHIAAKSGNVEIVRLLLLAGADIDRYNKDGLRAEDIAQAQGHIAVAEILSKLSESITTDNRLPLVRQLLPTKNFLKRLKFKVFGGGGVGKSSLIDSLKTGYFWNFFRRPFGASTAPMMQPEGTRNSVVTPFDCYTKGIDIQNVNVAGIGGLSIWEFSGYESYYSLYDFFIGDPSCIHAVVFRAKDDILVRRAQIFFWLNFIRARIAATEPLGHGGTQLWAPHILLIATHADEECCSKDSKGRWRMSGWDNLEKEIRSEFDLDLIIVPEVFVLNAHEANSLEITELKSTIEKMKTILTKYIGPELGFLELAIAELPAWRRILSDFPVVSWPSFVEYMRNKVNLLATEEHIKELMAQLQIVGEVIYITVLEQQDLVILDPKWLTTELIGKLYSFEQLSVVSPDGRLSLEQIHRLYPKAELTDIRKIFNGLNMSTEVLVTNDLYDPIDSVLIFDFPALNLLITPIPLWINLYLPSKPEDRVWGGVRFARHEQVDYQLLYVFARVLVSVRRSIAMRTEAVTSIRQWTTGIQFKVDEIACLVSLTHDRLNVDIVICANKTQKDKAFELCEYFTTSVVSTLEHACPGFCLNRLPLSPYDLMSNNFEKEARCYSNRFLLTAQLREQDHVEIEDNIKEHCKDIFAFGSKNIYKQLQFGANLHIGLLSVFARSRLARLLDEDHPEGKNWKSLARHLNIDESKINMLEFPTSENQQLPQPEVQTPRASATDSIITVWAYEQDSTMRKLADAFLLMDRMDAYEVLLSHMPTFIRVLADPPVHPTGDDPTEESDDEKPTEDVLAAQKRRVENVADDVASADDSLPVAHNVVSDDVITSSDISTRDGTSPNADESTA